MKLSDVGVNQTFRGCLAVRAASIGKTKRGDPFVNVTVFDGTTEMAAKIWQSNQAPEINSIIQAVAIVGVFQDALQLTIHRWSSAEAGTYQPEDFLPVCANRKSLWQELIVEASKIENALLKSFVLNLFTTFEDELYNAPAAKYHHHACLGGWLQHTYEVLRFSLAIAQESPYQIDFDILRAGAILHDIGKIYAYAYVGAVIDMSYAGKFLDHISLGLLTFERLCNKMPLEEEQELQLAHIIAAHHGTLEWGSPIEPITKEAIVIHKADALSASLYQVDAALQEAASRNQLWTDGKSKVTHFPMKVRQ